MATKIYIPAINTPVGISPAIDSAWEVSSLLTRGIASTTKFGDALQTIAFSEGTNVNNQDIIFAQLISAPLTVGQTITGAQALKAQCRVIETTSSNNMFLTVGIRVMNGTTVQKTVLAVTRDNSEASNTTLQNRQFTANSAATNYTTVAGDRLVIEVGMAGTPAAGNGHSCSMRLGSNGASDLAEDNTTTSDDNPWVSLTDTLTFIVEPCYNPAVYQSSPTPIPVMAAAKPWFSQVPSTHFERPTAIAVLTSQIQTAALSQFCTSVAADVGGFGLLELPVTSGMDWQVNATPIPATPKIEVRRNHETVYISPAAASLVVATWSPGVALVTTAQTQVERSANGFGILPIIPLNSAAWNVQTAVQTQPVTQVLTDLSGVAFAPAAEVITVNPSTWMTPEPRVGTSYHNGITPADEPVVLLYEDDQAAWTPVQRQIVTERVRQRTMNMDPQFNVTPFVPLAAQKWLEGIVRRPVVVPAWPKMNMEPQFTATPLAVHKWLEGLARQPERSRLASRLHDASQLSALITAPTVSVDKWIQAIIREPFRSPRNPIPAGALRLLFGQLVLTGNLDVICIPTEGRIYRVGPDPRTYDIGEENRIYRIPPPRKC